VLLATIADWKDLPAALTKAPSESFLTFGVPVILGILFLQSTLFVGISSWFNEEYDREWWGRAAGWVLLAGVLWITFSAITIYGPLAIYYAPRLLTGVGGVAGLISILLGKSGTTAATDKEKDDKAGPLQTVSNVVLGLAAPIFVFAILALLSLCTSRIILATRPPCSAHTSPDRCRPAADVKELALRAAGTYRITEIEPLPKGRIRQFTTSPYPALETDRIAAIEHLWAIDTTNLTEALAVVVGLPLLSLLMSFFIGANQFSAHSLYRNRLIRAYLGASRSDRLPNAFSGFDPTDNLPMDRLRPEVVWPSTFVDLARDGEAIVTDPTLTTIQPRTVEAVKRAAAHPGNTEDVRAAADLLAGDLNRAIDTLVLGKPSGNEPQSVANRRVLEAKYPRAFHPMDAHRKPIHVVNMALNLVSGDNLAWQERMAESFTASPLHAGSHCLGYRPASVYGGPSGVSLGTAVAISGAAASPNMGYHSSPALSFLLTLFNVRLGWWYGNPAKEKYGRRNPTNTLATILGEAFGNTNDQNNFVYLSDGGHFDNLGLYEMVLRRCHCIVVSDAGADPDFGFEDLGNAIRKIRIDLGIDIKVEKLQLFPRSEKNPVDPRYFAVGEICYGDVDPGAQPGKLLYLKPAFYGKLEPKDVYNYATTYKAFPHQSTADQFFSESQFESYRQLGYFAAGAVANGKTSFASVCDFIDQAGSPEQVE
jgi:hypothetical protein